MIYFRLMDLKVLIVLICILKKLSAGSHTTIPDKAILNTFIEEYVKPYVAALQLSNNAIFRAKDERTPEFIRKKVKELASFLEDNAETQDDDKLTLEREDETTIIDFSHQMVSNFRSRNAKQIEEKTNSFKSNIEKYKMLRTKIKKALKRENLSNRTRSLVTTTLDEMIAQMLAHQCSMQGDRKPVKNPKIIRALTENWEQLWTKIRKEYEKPEPRAQRQGDFLQKFQDLMTMMSNDLSTLTDEYNVVCKLTDANNEAEKDILRIKNLEHKADLKTLAEKELQGDEFDEKTPCSNFRICSDELKEFMIDFYEKLNETAVNVVRDYAAMFLRDVGDDSYHEKERVVGLIVQSGNSVKDKVTSIFTKQTDKFKLDPKKNKYSNMRYLYKFISKNIQHTKTAIRNALEEHLKSVKPELVQTIQKDINVNVDLELGNLEREVGGRICPAFEICNGKYFGIRRRNYVGNRNVYVRFKLDLDVDKNATKNVTEGRRGKPTVSLKDLTTYKTLRVIWTRSPLNLSVTRTPKLKFYVEIVKKGMIKKTISTKIKTKTTITKTTTKTKTTTTKRKHTFIKKSLMRKAQQYNATLNALKEKSLNEILQEFLSPNQIANKTRKPLNKDKFKISKLEVTRKFF